MSPDRIPLAAHTDFETEDVDEAREWASRALAKDQLRLVGDRQHLHLVHHGVKLGATSLHYLDYGTDVDTTADRLGFVLVQIPLSGQAVLRDNGEEFVATPDCAAVTDAADYHAAYYRELTPRLMIQIENATLESRLTAMLGGRPREQLRFDPLLDLTSPGGRSWHRLVDTIVEDFDCGGPISQSPLASASLELAVVDGLLAVLPGTYSDQLQAIGAPTRPRVLRKAMLLLEEHCAEPLTTADVAEAVGVSVRSLQEAFQNYLDTTPMAYLRAVRLRRIHEDLVAGGEGISVTDVALRWGVTHLGRFSREYREMFGHLPSETLRRGH